MLHRRAGMWINPMFDDIAISRFWSKVDKRGPDECWPWLGPLHRGYGAFGFKRKTYLSQRASMIVHGHDIPEKMHVDHMCRNRSCVNPNHLRIVTSKVNTLENSVSVTAINAAKTHCKRGHPFDEANTKYGRRRYERICRACRPIDARLKRQRDKQNAK